ncbi:hypothetical protein Tco_0269162 [Tanacetum coccineum]
MENLETQLNKETLHDKDSKSIFRMLNAQFQKFLHSKVLKTSNYDQDAREAREYLYKSARFRSLKQRMLVRETQTAVGLSQTIGIRKVQSMIAARQGMLKAHRNIAAHLEIKVAGQGMNAVKEAILGMI